MRVAYLLHSTHRPSAGIHKKIIAQTRRWKTNAVEAACFLLTNRDDSEELERAFHNVPVFTRHYTYLLDSFRAARQLVDDILAWQPDLVYFRQALYYPPYSKLSTQVPIVVEINSDMGHELLMRSRLRYWYYRLTHNEFMRRVSGLIFVTAELSRNPQYVRFGELRKVIANGIELEKYNVLPAPINNQPRLIFIGARWAPWKGVDKILWLARRFPDWRFDLVGEHGGDDGDMPPNMVVHHYMPSAEYERLLAQADVALSSLALYRAGLYEASTLSTREYLAYGIPTIIGYSETDFPSPKEFLLQLPCTPQNVEERVDDIERFVHAMQGKRVPREAIAHLDVAVKERERLAFFNEIVADYRSRRL